MHKDRNGALDALRIVATIFIVFHHYQQVTGAYFENSLNFYNGKFYFGWLVEFFFVLSGFLSVHSIPQVQKGERFSRYYLHKAVRLLPLVAIGAVVYELLLLLYMNTYHTSWFDIMPTLWGTIITILGVQDGWVFANPCVNNPMWYISVLMLCYIILYFIVYLSHRLKIPVLYLQVFVVLIGVGTITYGINLPFLNNSTGRGFSAFFFGVIVGQNISKRLVNKSLNRWVEAIAVVGTCAVILWIFIDDDLDSANYLLTFVLYPALIVLASNPIVAKAFHHSLWTWLGKISFDVYVWHNPLFLAMYIARKCLNLNFSFDDRVTMLIFTAATIVLSVCSYYCIERPIQRVAKRVIA